MDSRIFWLLGLTLIPAMTVVAQSKRGPFEGAWQAVEVTHSAAGRPVTLKPGPNLTIFSGKHYSRVDVQTDKARPVLSNIADCDRRSTAGSLGPVSG